MIINVDNVNVFINGKKILSNISFSVKENGLYFILGANGSGKSTLLQTIVRLLPYTGKITILGRDLRNMKRKEISKTIGYVWQNPFHGFFEYTVRREIAFILKNLQIYSEEKIDSIANSFEISHLLERSPFTLSGGEAKRVSLSSVLVADQPIVLLDEPESAMDIAGINKVIAFSKKNMQRKVIIIATHNTFLAIKMKQMIRKIFLIKNGKLLGSYDTSILDDSELLESIGVVSLRWLHESP